MSLTLSELKNSEKGNRCFILACGPSLLDCSEAQFKGENLIAVNHAIQRFPLAKYSVIADLKSYETIGPTNNILFSSSEPQRLPGAIYTKDLGSLPGWSWDLTKGVYNGHTSSYMALQFAVWLGFSPVFFLGLDLHDSDILTHFYGKRAEVEESPKQRRALQAAMRKSFEWAKENELKDKYEIYNLSKTSTLKAFPFRDLDEVLSAD